MSQTTECRWWQQAIQIRLDGEIDDERSLALDTHLDRCAACRAYEAGLVETLDALGDLPMMELPDEDLEAVLNRTVRAESRPWFRYSAVAAGLVLVLLAGWFWLSSPGSQDVPVIADAGSEIPEEMTAEEAAAEARMVLAVLASALRKSEEAALVGVLAGEVSPALRKIPVTLPGKPSPGRSDS